MKRVVPLLLAMCLLAPLDSFAWVAWAFKPFPSTS